jgi:hypothetical protein
MSSRRSLLLSLAVAATLVAGACTAPSGAELDDPIDILVAGMTAAEQATSVHVETTMDGSVPLDLVDELGGSEPGLSGGGGSLDLTGSVVGADVDREAEAARITFSLPSFLSATGEIIVIDEAAYVQTSLFGDAWYRFDESDMEGHGDGDAKPSSSPEDPEVALREALADLPTPPERLADERCGDDDCYHVRLVMEPGVDDELATIAPDWEGTGTADVWIRKSDQLPSQVVLVATGDGTDFKVTMTFGDWGQRFDITAPPADQVLDGDELPFPGGELPFPGGEWIPSTEGA